MVVVKIINTCSFFSCMINICMSVDCRRNNISDLWIYSSCVTINISFLLPNCAPSATSISIFSLIFINYINVNFINI